MGTSTLLGKHIFLVYDDITSLLTLVNALTFHRASFDYAPWDSDVVSYMTNCLPIHLVILNHHYADGTAGDEILQTIRTHRNLHSIPIVAVSTHDHPVERQTMNQSNFAGFLEMPVCITNISDFVLNAMMGKHVASLLA